MRQLTRGFPFVRSMLRRRLAWAWSDGTEIAVIVTARIRATKLRRANRITSGASPTGSNALWLRDPLAGGSFEWWMQQRRTRLAAAIPFHEDCSCTGFEIFA